MFSLEEAKVLIDFLDRVPLTGHQERANMNVLVERIVNVGKKAIEKTEGPEDAKDS